MRNLGWTGMRTLTICGVKSFTNSDEIEYFFVNKTELIVNKINTLFISTFSAKNRVPIYKFGVTHYLTLIWWGFHQSLFARFSTKSRGASCTKNSTA